MTMKNDARFEGLLAVSKLTWRVWRVLHLQVSKMCPLMSSFWTKHTLFELKKYSGVMVHDIEEWCKIWRKTNLWFGKWHVEFDKFWSEHLKVSKLGHWWDSFIQSRKCMSLKFTEELCIITMKNDAKFEEELACRFKIDTTIWRILTPALEYLKNVYFNGSFWAKYIMFELKKYRRVMFDGTEDWDKIWGKTD